MYFCLSITLKSLIGHKVKGFDSHKRVKCFNSNNRVKGVNSNNRVTGFDNNNKIKVLIVIIG